jgi:hypothetical protein
MCINPGWNKFAYIATFQRNKNTGASQTFKFSSKLHLFSHQISIVTDPGATTNNANLGLIILLRFSPQWLCNS